MEIKPINQCNNFGFSQFKERRFSLCEVRGGDKAIIRAGSWQPAGKPETTAGRATRNHLAKRRVFCEHSMRPAGSRLLEILQQGL
jgi:hypothetical protein